MDDLNLLRAYAKNRSEAAFAELVRRHLDWVYSAAWRQTGDPHLAEDVTQAVFVLLARKAGALANETILGGWLFRTTRFVAARAVRAEIRRQQREQFAVAMNASDATSDPSDSAWGEISPLLDEAVATLPESDRAAVILRFYERQPMQEVGQRLGISEDAAKKRVSRAVEKLRGMLARRGLASGGVMLATVLATHAVHAAPGPLASSVLKASLAGAATAAVSPALVNQALTAWRWTRLKLVAGMGVVAVLLFVVINSTWRQPANPANTEPRPFAVTPVTAFATGTNIPPARPAFKRAGALRGLVMDHLERPVSGAQVWVGDEDQPGAKTATDSDGRFELETPGTQKLISVMAEGYAIDQQTTESNALTPDLVFHLGPAPPVPFRVIDEAGQGVPDAMVVLENWWGQRFSVALRSKTDSEGRLEWRSAPKGELTICVLKNGYQCSRRNKFVADGKEHIIMLRPALEVTGGVTDADSGEPVPEFKVTPGYVQMFSGREESTTFWDQQDPVPGANGLYRVVLLEEEVPTIRIEAEGYDVTEARPSLTNSHTSRLDFQLRRTDTNNTIRGTVILPDGSSAVGVEVALCTFQRPVEIEGFSIKQQRGPRNSGNLEDFNQITDAGGRFSFASRPGAHTVVAVSSAGIGQVHCFDFKNPLEIQLRSWGRIQGVVR
ncbi:MAG TPA: sigma-70 family RNA polymerase sigma factor, partial [Verrucomicrobiae bacterium]|nr:sigma-70 family RNA polymerase sigma factor [Verrucomicrobiae bacterium]